MAKKTKADVEKRIRDLVIDGDDSQTAVEQACFEYELGGGWEHNPTRYSFY